MMIYGSTGCCIVGGGPAGMVLGLLLARGGVETTVLEKHADFLRDFRGDTVHPTTLTLLDELGLGEEFATLPPRWVEQMSVELDSGTYRVADLTKIPGPHKHIAFVPQWDLLDILAKSGEHEPSYSLIMEAEVTDLLRDGNRISGVIYHRDGQRHELRAPLVVGCDGRTSIVREQAGLRPRTFGAPMDVLWFRLPRRADDPQGGVFRVSEATIMILIDRGDYFQIGVVIKKGSYESLRDLGIESFRRRLSQTLPWLDDRLESLSSFDDIRLLNVVLSRLEHWYADGLLCIGDAAHAMSPVGGVGINLAIQDAVAAARVLVPALRANRVSTETLRRIQLRRWFPTVVTQTFQRIAHRFIVARRIDEPEESLDPTAPPLAIRLLQRFPALQGLPAAFIGIGALPEHAPEFARR
jgi:2-polyprenyl-6-methoxyphenol hydroxylase-like FAD-dependent oxidoreductase